MNYLFFDTETTGLPANYKAHFTDVHNWPRVVQLAWMLADDEGKVLMQRCDIINDFTAQNAKAGASDQTLIEIHVDSRTRDTKTDVFFYYRPESEPSRKLALRIHQTFLQKYLKKRSQRGYNGSVTPRYLYMLKETTTPKAVYIELGNIRNDWDQQRLVLKNNRQAVANWLCEALMGQ